MSSLLYWGLGGREESNPGPICSQALSRTECVHSDTCNVLSTVNLFFSSCYMVQPLAMAHYCVFWIVVLIRKASKIYWTCTVPYPGGTVDPISQASKLRFRSFINSFKAIWPVSARFVTWIEPTKKPGSRVRTDPQSEGLSKGREGSQFEPRAT